MGGHDDVIRSKPDTVWMDVTPEMAQHWLDHRNTRNRDWKHEGYTDRMAIHIRAGEYESTHQGIAFDVDGVLVDGQHRLKAIVKAGVAVHMPVTFGLQRRVRVHVDEPIIRSLPDAAKIEAGISFSNFHAATLRGMFILRQMWLRERTREEKIALMQEHAGVIRSASDMICQAPKGVRQGIVAGVLARALYKIPVQTVRHFGQVLTDGIQTNGALDRPVILLREALQNKPGDRMESRKRYRLTERALQAIHRGENPQILRVVNTELFPLSGEGEDVDPE